MEINKMELHFIDISGGTIMKKKVTSLPLKEKIIINRSIEWFYDPEPCMIHRSAVMKRIYSEIFDYFEELLKQKITEWQWASVPDQLKQVLDINMEIQCVLLK
jgi:hypothetical protein